VVKSRKNTSDPTHLTLKPSAETDPEFKYRTGAPGESTAEQRYFTPEFKGLGVYKAGTEPGPSFYGKPTAEQLALYSKPKDSPLQDLKRVAWQDSAGAVSETVPSLSRLMWSRISVMAVMMLVKKFLLVG
jgi:hypothetical protein